MTKSSNTILEADQTDEPLFNCSGETYTPQDITDAREQAGLTYRELADDLDINYRTLKEYERGRQRPQILMRFKLAAFIEEADDDDA